MVVSEFVTLDGVIEDPAWTFPFRSEEQERYKFTELKAADALLLGRVTYEGFAAAWPQMAEQTGEYGAMMNGYPKYVASTTLDTAEWNASLLKGEIVVRVYGLDGGAPARQRALARALGIDRRRVGSAGAHAAALAGVS